jgi:hypothetical protein
LQETEKMFFENSAPRKPFLPKSNPRRITRMPIQVLKGLDTPGAEKVVAQLRQGRIKMSATVARASADIVELTRKGIAVFEDPDKDGEGELRLVGEPLF